MRWLDNNNNLSSPDKIGIRTFLHMEAGTMDIDITLLPCSITEVIMR